MPRPYVEAELAWLVGAFASKLVFASFSDGTFTSDVVVFQAVTMSTLALLPSAPSVTWKSKVSPLV